MVSAIIVITVSVNERNQDEIKTRRLTIETLQKDVIDVQNSQKTHQKDVSKLKLSAKIVNGCNSLTIFTKSSILVSSF